MCGILDNSDVQDSRGKQKLRDLLAEKILKKISGVSVNGLPATAYRSKEAVGRWQAGSLEQCLPNILNLSIEGIESDALVLYLDAAGVAVSGKSSCKSSDSGQSHVIMAIRGNVDSGTVRFSLGRETTREDVVYVVKEFSRIIPLLREARAQSDQV